LSTHDPSNLNQVIQVMHDPRREMLAEGHSAELGMLAGTVEIGRSQSQRREASKAFGS
jgi:hypothetical protein